MELFRVLIVDDYEPWSRQLTAIIEKEPSYKVISTVSDGYAALKKAEEIKPDLVLLDISLPTLNGIEVVRSLQRFHPKPFVVFVTQNATPSIVRAALEAGGNGYVLKTYAHRDLLPAIKIVCSGGRFLSAKLNTSTTENTTDR